MLVAPGLEQATLEFPDGSSLETPFDVLDAETTLVAFMPPDVQTLPARNEHRPRPAEAVEKAVVAQGEEEAPGDVHEGWLAPQIVKMVMKKHNGRLRDCYQKYLGGNPETAVVKARIRFTVGLSGKVVDSGATTNVDDGTLEACLAGAVTSITFPAPEGGTIEFEYPISFSPK